jgi:hypothetical protein
MGYRGDDRSGQKKGPTADWKSHRNVDSESGRLSGPRVGNGSRLAETNRLMLETNRLNAERFARVEAMLIEHNRLLADYCASSRR